MLLPVVAVLALAGWAGASGVPRAPDPRLDSALEHLTTARALLEASEAGDVPARAQRQFNRHVTRAENAIDNAIDAIVQAKAVSDDGQ